MLAGALWWGTPLLVSMGSFFALMVAQGLINTNGGAMASSEVPAHPGTSSAVLGLVQWTTAGAVAPMAGLGGINTAVPMAVLMIAGAVLSLFGLLVLARPDKKQPSKNFFPSTHPVCDVPRITGITPWGGRYSEPAAP